MVSPKLDLPKPWNKTRRIQKCLCGSPRCKELSKAFGQLGDRRGLWVSVPSAKQDSRKTSEIEFRNKRGSRFRFHMEKARNSLVDNVVAKHSGAKTEYVAYHHFHLSILERGTLSAFGEQFNMPQKIEKQYVKSCLKDPGNYTKDDGWDNAHYMTVPTCTLDEAQSDLQALKEHRFSCVSSPGPEPPAHKGSDIQEIPWDEYQARMEQLHPRKAKPAAIDSPPGSYLVYSSGRPPQNQDGKSFHLVGAAPHKLESSAVKAQRRYKRKREASQMRRGSPMILVFGMSYPLKPGHITEQSIVSNSNELEEIDSRDLLRLRRTEQLYGVQAVTVSLNKAAEYRSTHVNGNFCKWKGSTRRPGIGNQVEAVLNKFHSNRFLVQATLDFFWCPDGSWGKAHWKAGFFKDTLKEVCPLMQQPEENGECCHRGFGVGCVYLPLNTVTLDGVTNAKDVLSQCYNISFVKQKHLKECMLWKATQTIDEGTLAHLGKKKAQEKETCGITNHKLVGMGIKDRVMAAFPELDKEDAKDLTMIRLQRMPSKLSR